MQFAKNLQRFRLITFDITDTLLRFREDPFVIYKDEAKKFGLLNIEENKIKKCFRESFQNMTQKYPNFGAHAKDMTDELWWKMLVTNTFLCIDPYTDGTLLSDLADNLFKVFRTKECWTHIDCGVDLVQRMRQIGKCVGVISNFDSTLETVLQEMQITNLFDFIITSYEAGVQKPERGIFDLARKQSGANPEEALHIGNSFELDYLGATKNSGWSGLLATKNRENIVNVQDEFVYENICDMLKALETKDFKW